MTPRSFATSAGATYLDKAARVAAVRRAAERAAMRLPSIQRVVLFGSLVAGTATPRSDADLLVVLESSEHARLRDRVPGVLEALSPLPCPLDVFVLTAQEFERAQREAASLVTTAISTGIDLLGSAHDRS